MLGCSKDHAKEIDLYSKSYSDKIDRVRTQMKQAQQAMEAANEVQQLGEEGADEERKAQLQKSIYYYTQAILVFYYLVPEDEEEEKESDGLKFDCHFEHAEVLRLSTRYLEALSEISLIENMHDNEKWRSQKLPSVKELKAKTLLDLQRYDDSLKALGPKLGNEDHPH